MGFEIVWTKKAVQTFEKRILYLQIHWTQKEILNFTAAVNQYLHALTTQPLMFQTSSAQKEKRIGVIIKQVSLIYRIDKQTQTIQLIAFIDNRQNPDLSRFY
ncbi:MAG: type II toxin-antitoxin system RelE/ParE family toxin [Sphingobacteriaceae bacterium]|nr:MAG: type II toxin-antitoxin system RelE/ParE family toxin [Sphingobacteriaceae bacterium]